MGAVALYWMECHKDAMISYLATAWMVWDCFLFFVFCFPPKGGGDLLGGHDEFPTEWVGGRAEREERGNEAV